MKKLLIYVDMDGIITDLLQKWLVAINKKHKTNYTVADVKDWDVGNLDKDRIGHKAYKFITQPMFFYDLEPLPGSQAAVEALQIMGHDVNILTAPASDHCATEKLLWLKKYFPFVNHKNIHITHRKDLLRGDVLIDDRSKNCLEFQAANPDALVMAFGYEYNTDLYNHPTIKVIGRWEDTETAWERACKEIQKKAENESTVATTSGLPNCS